MGWPGLATNLKRTPWFKIQRALLDMQFRRAERQLAIQPGCAQIEQLRRRVAEEYEVFCNAGTAWTRLREKWLLDTKRTMITRWEQSIQSNLEELEHGLHFQYRPMRELDTQLCNLPAP